MNKLAMVTTRGKKRSLEEEIEKDVNEIAENSDDEAPEEITLTTGRKEIQKIQKDQQQAQIHAAKVIKERRKKRMVARQEQKQTAQRSHEGDADADEDLDLLPEDFLASLAEREANDRRLMERRLVSEQLRNIEAIDRAPKSRRKTLLDNRKVKGFTVQVMGAESSRKASESAKAFLEQKIRRGVRRSNDMLKPPRRRGVSMNFNR